MDWSPDSVDIDADDALSPDAPGRPSAADAADEWLASFLEGGERPSREVYEAGEAAGFSSGQLKRARQRVGVEARREGMPSQTVWRLPDGDGCGQSVHEAPVSQTVNSLDRLNPQVGPVGPASPVGSLPSARADREPTGGTKAIAPSSPPAPAPAPVRLKAFPFA